MGYSGKHEYSVCKVVDAGVEKVTERNGPRNNTTIEKVVTKYYNKENEEEEANV